MNTNVRKITDGAMMCAIVGVMLLINRQFAGLMEEMLLFAFPLPMVFFAAKYGWKDALLPFAAMVLLSVVLGTPQTIFYVASESLLGLVYGGGIYLKQGRKRLLVSAIIIAILANIITTIIYASFFGYDIPAEIAELQNIMENMFAQTGMGMPSTIDMPRFLLTIYIASTIMIGIMQGFVTHILSLTMLKRMRFEVPAAGGDNLRNPPKWSGYVALACMMGYFFAVSRGVSNPVLESALQGLGVFGIMYLVFYGYICFLTMFRGRTKLSRLLYMLLALFFMMTATLAMAFIGFLYITTGLYTKIMEGRKNAEENQ